MEFYNKKQEEYVERILLQREQDSHDTGSLIDSTSSTITNKFGFSNDISNEFNEMVDVITDTSSAPTFSVNVKSKIYTGELVIIDFSWYEPYKELGDNIICIFVYVNFLWHIFLKLPDIINGAGATEYSAFDSMVGEIKAYRVNGSGRSRSIK